MYNRIKKATIWIPLIGILIFIIFEKDDESSMYDLYFNWGSGYLVIISILWHCAWFYILLPYNL